MNLFFISDNKILPTPETLLIKEFENIWNRDKTKTKDIASKELAYIYFISDYKSIYNNYLSLIKETKIKEDIIQNKDWKPDLLIESAIKKYEELQITPTLRLLNGARKALEEMTRYYEHLKINDRNILASATSLDKLGKIAESFDKLEEKIKKEQLEGRSKANREINPFEI